MVELMQLHLFPPTDQQFKCFKQKKFPPKLIVNTVNLKNMNNIISAVQNDLQLSKDERSG